MSACSTGRSTPTTTSATAASLPISPAAFAAVFGLRRRLTEISFNCLSPSMTCGSITSKRRAWVRARLSRRRTFRMATNSRSCWTRSAWPSESFARELPMPIQHERMRRCDWTPSAGRSDTGAEISLHQIGIDEPVSRSQTGRSRDMAQIVVCGRGRRYPGIGYRRRQRHFRCPVCDVTEALPSPDADRLVRVFAQPPGTTATRNRTPLHAVDYVRFRADSRLLEAVEGFWPLSRALGGADGEHEVVAAAGASPGVFALLGGSPILGRTFSPDEDRVGARVVTVSHALWQQRFGGDASIIGRTVLLDREPHEVIGVMNAGFEPGFIDAQLWTPLGIHEGHLP